MARSTNIKLEVAVAGTNVTFMLLRKLPGLTMTYVLGKAIHVAHHPAFSMLCCPSRVSLLARCCNGEHLRFGTLCTVLRRFWGWRIMVRLSLHKVL